GEGGGSMSSGEVPRIGFLGAGRMATALARGWLNARLAAPDRLLASDPVPQARDAFQEVTGVPAVADNRQVVSGSDVLILAVKPQSMTALLKEIRPTLGARHLVVSVAAGFTLRQLAEGLGADRRLVRVMPNTPCLVGASASAYTPGEVATTDDIA